MSKITLFLVISEVIQWAIFIFVFYYAYKFLRSPMGAMSKIMGVKK